MPRITARKRSLAELAEQQRYDRQLIHGADRIAEYLGITLTTLHRWRKYQSLPVSKFPGGCLVTSTELIDRWLLARTPSIAKHMGME